MGDGGAECWEKMHLNRRRGSRGGDDISRFPALSGVFSNQKIFRASQPKSILNRMKVNLCPVTTVRQCCRLPWKFQGHAILMHRSYTFCICTEQPPPPT